MLSPPQPNIFAAEAGTTANTTAAIAAAPSNFLIMLPSLRTDPASLPESVERLIRRIVDNEKTFAINSA
jgi:hypothetical protein